MLNGDQMLIGYACVSATHQNLDRQLAMLKAEGCGRIFKRKLSGREGVRRPKLDKAIEALGTGDVLVLAGWDRATRSMLDGITKSSNAWQREAQPSRRSTGSGWISPRRSVEASWPSCHP
jgi:Resolvase, N terminal domain